MNILIFLLAFIWELPQTLLFLILFLIYRKETVIFKYNFAFYFIINNPKFTGISLGRFILLDRLYYKYNIIKHEYGHSIQSLIFGWLYLLIIGIPSFIKSKTIRNEKEYYSGYPENWADKLGGVKR